MEITDIKEIRERIDAIAVRIYEINKEQMSSGLELARQQGTDTRRGIKIDPLTEWARRMKELNAEIAALVFERRELKEKKRLLGKTECECDCH